MIYGKKEANMTRGLAILSMLILHLFCGKGVDVYGTPLLWITETTPLVYYFGFFAEICVPLYSMCAGYARRISGGYGSCNYKGNLKRIWRLLVNYWIVLVLFSVLGLIFNPTGNIPNSTGDFIKSIFLLHSYNGAWWFLNTYIILLLIPDKILMYPVKKVKPVLGLIGCIFLNLLYYLACKFGVLPETLFSNQVLAFIWKEIYNLLHVIPYFYAGAFMCDIKIIDKASNIMQRFIKPKHQKPVLLVAFICLFVVVSLLEKAATIFVTAILVFLLFNLWQKGKIATEIFMFLGKHSTNVWLVHMFFYSRTYGGLAIKARYPILMLVALLALSVISSYVIMSISEIIKRILSVKER